MTETTSAIVDSMPERVIRLEAARSRLLDNGYVADTPWLRDLMERKAGDAAAEMRLLARSPIRAASPLYKSVPE